MPGCHRRQHSGSNGNDSHSHYLVASRARDARAVPTAVRPARPDRDRCCSRSAPAWSAPGSCCAGSTFFSHAAGTATFPGLVLAEGLGFAAPLGAMAAALVYAVSLGGLARPRRSGYDSVTALALAGALALGVILASDVFHSGAERRLAAVRQPAADRAARPAAGRRRQRHGADRQPRARSGLDRGRLRRRQRPCPRARTRLHDDRAADPDRAGGRLAAVGARRAAGDGAAGRPGRDHAAVDREMRALATGDGRGGRARGKSPGLWLSVQTDAPPGATIAVLAGGLFALSAGAARARPPARRRGRRRRRAGGGGARSRRLRQLRRRARAIASTSSRPRPRSATGPAGSAATDANVTQLLKPNTDPHDYEPRPSDVEAVAKADVVFKNGDRLDDWIDKVVEQSGGDPQVVDLSGGIPTRCPASRRVTRPPRYDPHWWHDPRNAAAAVEQIRETLDRIDPAARETFNANTRAYLAKLRRLDREIEAVHRSGSATAAQARHRPRRLRLLRQPLRHRCDRRRDPVAEHAGAAVGGRDREALGHGQDASGSRRSFPRARSTRSWPTRSPSRRARWRT